MRERERVIERELLEREREKKKRREYFITQG